MARPQVIKKLWHCVKADAKLLAVFGKPQVTMFELAGIVGKHLG